MRILVTGGAGYIGSHTAKALAKAGFEAVVYDNLCAGHRWAVQWGPLVEGHLSDKELLTKTLREHHIEAVMHFAAFAFVGESMTKPHKYFRNNVADTLTLLEAMHETGVAPIVFSSSCATYGTPSVVPISEMESQKPVNPYGESKLMVERMLRWFGEVSGQRYACLRYFNAAGADPEGQIGEAHEVETHLIPLAIHAAQGRRARLDVFGTDYDTPDGTAVRDYIHVNDLADAHISALRHLIAGGDHLALNLGVGRGYSVREVVESVERVSGRAVPLREAGRREGDPPALVADASKARQLLNWSPRFTHLDQIVQTAWQWHSEGEAKCKQQSMAVHA